MAAILLYIGRTMLQGFVFVLAFLLSGAWLAGAATYVDGHIGWENFGHQHPSELAALLAGVFAPLALLWLLVAYFRQASAQQQLAFALKQLQWQARKSAEQTETIVRQLGENGGQARQAAALDILDRGMADLQAQTARLALDFGRLAPRDLPELWRATSNGDRFAFMNALLGRDGQIEEIRADLAHRLSEAPEIKAQAMEFVQLQERLCDFATRHGIDALVREGLDQGPPAKVHALLLSALRAAPTASPQRPAQAESANPSAALLAHKVAKVLWPEGAARSPVSPRLEALFDEQAPAPAPVEPQAPPPAPAPAAQPQPQQQQQQQGDVIPFSPLSPGFPSRQGP